MKATLYKANGNKKNIEVNSFTELQFFVGGDVAHVKELYGNFFCNEDGEPFNLDPNPHFLNLLLGDIVELHGDPNKLPYDKQKPKTNKDEKRR